MGQVLVAIVRHIQTGNNFAFPDLYTLPKNNGCTVFHHWTCPPLLQHPYGWPMPQPLSNDKVKTCKISAASRLLWTNFSEEQHLHPDGHKINCVSQRPGSLEQSLPSSVAPLLFFACGQPGPQQIIDLVSIFYKLNHPLSTACSKV